MYEVTVTITRQDTKEDFYVFSLYDKEMMYAHLNYRNEMMNAPGFMATSIALSDDKMQLKVIALWETQTHAAEFFKTNKHGKRFDRAMISYLGRTGCTREVSLATLPDTAKLKAKKLSSRLTVEYANQQLKEFLTQQRESKFIGEHVAFSTDDEPEQDNIS